MIRHLQVERSSMEATAALFYMGVGPPNVYMRIFNVHCAAPSTCHICRMNIFFSLVTVLNIAMTYMHSSFHVRLHARPFERPPSATTNQQNNTHVDVM